MWKFLSRSKKLSPDAVPAEAFRDMAKEFLEMRETLKGLSEDNLTINTAINRIERKQNRWLDVLNEHDIKGDNHIPQPPEAEREYLAGEATIL